MTNRYPVELWPISTGLYLAPSPDQHARPKLERRASVSGDRVKLPMAPRALRQVQDDPLRNSTGLAISIPKEIRIGLWNIQNFGGGISCMWNPMTKPAGYDNWLAQHNNVWTVALPDIQRGKTRQAQLKLLLRENGFGNALDDEIVKYHDLVLRAYGLADHINTLDCDVIVLLEVMQRWSGSSVGGSNTTSIDFLAIYFLYGAWYALQNGEEEIDYEYGKYDSVDERILNFLGEKMPEPDEPRAKLTLTESNQKRVGAFMEGRNMLLEIQKDSSQHVISGKLTKDLALNKYGNCFFCTREGGSEKQRPLGCNDLDLAEYVYQNNDALFFGALLAEHDRLLPRAYRETEKDLKGGYLAQPVRSPYNTLAKNPVNWDAPVFNKVGTGRKLYDAIQASKRLWRAMIERRGWAYSAEHMIVPIEEEPDEDEEPAFKPVLDMLNARLKVLDHSQFVALKKPPTLKSAETIAIATRETGEFEITEGQQWFREGGKTFERPVYVINVEAKNRSGLSCTLLAGHAPSPVHWEKHTSITKKWFSDLNELADNLQKDSEIPVVMAGDFNVKGDNLNGLSCFEKWRPPWGEHKDFKTSYALRGDNPETRWSESYDKILVHEDAGQVGRVLYRDGRWAGASPARKYSDHSFIVADLSVRVHESEPQYMFKSFDLPTETGDGSQSEPASGSESVQKKLKTKEKTGSSASSQKIDPMVLEETPPDSGGDGRKTAEKRNRSRKKAKARKRVKGPLQKATKTGSASSQSSTHMELDESSNRTEGDGRKKAEKRNRPPEKEDARKRVKRPLPKATKTGSASSQSSTHMELDESSNRTEGDGRKKGRKA